MPPCPRSHPEGGQPTRYPWGRPPPASRQRGIPSTSKPEFIRRTSPDINFQCTLEEVNKKKRLRSPQQWPGPQKLKKKRKFYKCACFESNFHSQAPIWLLKSDTFARPCPARPSRAVPHSVRTAPLEGGPRAQTVAEEGPAICVAIATPPPPLWGTPRGQGSFGMPPAQEQDQGFAEWGGGGGAVRGGVLRESPSGWGWVLPSGPKGWRPVLPSGLTPSGLTCGAGPCSKPRPRGGGRPRPPSP